MIIPEYILFTSIENLTLATRSNEKKEWTRGGFFFGRGVNAYWKWRILNINLEKVDFWYYQAEQQRNVVLFSFDI